MTEVVLEVVALCFQRVEVLIFNFPATAACLHQLHHRLFANEVAGDPGVLKGDLPFVVENLQLHPGDYRAVLFRIQADIVEPAVAVVTMIPARPGAALHRVNPTQLIQALNFFI